MIYRYKNMSLENILLYNVRFTLCVSQKKVNTKDLVLNRREAIINFWNFFQLSGLIKTPHLLDFEKFSNTLSFLSRNLLFY